MRTTSAKINHGAIWCTFHTLQLSREKYMCFDVCYGGEVSMGEETSGTPMLWVA